ncbi:hypothetical protein EJ110_NYTH02717 [Nymphaea thermarum]|nr:hypothetical protein EJ110_NYTH02717 [Nymphaea thermarum]
MGMHRLCFCSGVGKSERMKGSIFCSKGPAMANVCGGTGFFIHRALLLTTHTNLPSVSAAEGVDIQLQCQSSAKLMPHRFFITSSVLDLTVVGFDIMETSNMSHVQQPHHLKTCSHPCLELGSMVYLLGRTNMNDLTVGDGKVVIATDNLIKIATGGVTWTPGSAGFDAQGNLAFMVCDPMKLASSPATRSSSTASSTSSMKDHSTQFGIPIPIICQWLNQHWEGTLDELSKPRLPLIHLVSTGQKSEPSSASFTRRSIFKSEEEVDTLSSQICSKHVNHHASSGLATSTARGERTRAVHEQGIPTPVIYESPMLTASCISKTENPHSDINFPHKNSEAVVLPLLIKGGSTQASIPRQLITSHPDGNHAEEVASDCRSNIVETPLSEATFSALDAEANVSNINFVDDAQSEVQSSSLGEFSAQHKMPIRFHDEYTSDAETMYSAETMESRNYSSPREVKLPQVGRSQSCGSRGRWSNDRRKSLSGHGLTVERQQSLLSGRKFSSSRTHDYFGPTVSSIMKKRNNGEQPKSRARSGGAQLSPRWMF